MYERHSCDVPTACQPPGADETRWDGVIRDISQGGVGIVLRRRFERNACLALELPGREGESPSTVFVRVVHLRADAGGSWLHGCRFVSELSDEELRRILSRGPVAVPAPAPAAPTLPPEAPFIVGVTIEVEYPGGPPVRCRVERFRAVHPWPVPAGKTLHLGGIPIDGCRAGRLYRVLSCEPDGEGWQLRLQLLSALPSAPGSEL